MTEIRVDHQVRPYRRPLMDGFESPQRERAQFVWRVEVIEWPEHAKDPNWEPPGWDGHYRPFRWPRPRAFLSQGGAERLAMSLSELGCRVRIRRSQPVTFRNGMVYGTLEAQTEWMHHD